jgi:hypothetical protein
VEQTHSSRVALYMVLYESFLNILIKTVTSYLHLIMHHHLLSSPLGSAHTDPSVSATFEMHPVFLC